MFGDIFPRTDLGEYITKIDDKTVIVGYRLVQSRENWDFSAEAIANWTFDNGLLVSRGDDRFKRLAEGIVEATAEYHPIEVSLRSEREHLTSLHLVPTVAISFAFKQEVWATVSAASLLERMRERFRTL